MNTDYTQGREKLSYMISEMEKVVVGKKREITLMLMALLSGGHVLIEDIPGTGKTTAAAALAAVCGLSFKRAQFTPDVMASDITGFNMYNRKTESFDFIEGLAMCNILLADEINRASPKTQSALLEAMEERKVTVDGKAYVLPDPFFVIATQNPAGFVGTYPLPEAQLDRFAVRLSLGYPTKDEEIRIISDRMVKNPLSDVKPAVTASDIKEMTAAVSEIQIDEKIYSYIVELVRKTRNTPEFEVGASPRASLIISKMAQAEAYINGRGYVIPEDAADVFVPVTAHRIAMKKDIRSKDHPVEKILYGILKNTETPSVL